MNRITKVMFRTAATILIPAVKNTGRVILLVAMLLNMLFIQPIQPVAAAGNPVPVQTYYVPFPESQLLLGLQTIFPLSPAQGGPADPMTTYISLAAIASNTIIYYDQWENGYESDISNPVNLYSAVNTGGTQIWGDGNPANGAPPGVPSDVINSGTVVILNNTLVSGTPLTIDFDGRDKFAATKNIAVTRTGWASGTGTILAGAIEVFDTQQWGTSYRAPVGENIPSNADFDSFSYTGLVMMAGAGGATVQIDADANNSFETTVTLSEGQSYFVNGGVNVGGRVTSNNPVQVDILTGFRGNTASRDSALVPTSAWSQTYYTPVSTIPSAGTSVWLYNPGSSSISVTYTRRVSGTLTSGIITVPGGTSGGYLKQDLPAGTGASFSSAQNFYAFSTTDTTQFSTGWDWGFSLIPPSSLTPQVLVGLGIGRDPTSPTNPTENGNPVWITPIGNGDTVVPVYADFDANPATGANTDPNGNRYDVMYTLRELDQQKIFDTADRNQTGLLVYVLTPGVKLAAAWGQDPLVASVSAPGLDVGTSVPPIALFSVGKNGSLKTDNDGDGFISLGDELEYTIVTNNVSRTIVSNIILQDNLPANLSYVANSTFNGATQISDSGSTALPLDEGGTNIGTLSPGGSSTVTFRALISSLGFQVVNTGSASAAGFTVPFTSRIPLGGIGNFVWSDANLNGIQDAGEAGIPGVVVNLYNNATSTLVATAITNSLGRYAFTGLDAANYFIEFVKPAGYTGTLQNQGTDDTVDSDANPTTGRTNAFGWSTGQTNSTIDAGFWTPTPSIKIQKTPDTQTVNYGQTATFTIIVTNNGNVALSNVSVSDPLAPNCNRAIGNVGIGVSYSIICQYANVTGNFTNTATASGAYNSTTVTASDSADVSLPPDTTAPTAAPTQSPAANGAGWNNSDVTIAWNWADNVNGAGIDAANCTMTSVSSSQGNAVTLTATCRDFAGNTGSASYTLKVDKSAPNITGSRSPAANANGWNNSDVTVTFSCTDALSGVATGSPTGDTVLTGEGANQSATGICYDVADNSSSATVSGVNIDKTAPNTILTGPSDWTNADVTLTLGPNDALSGVSATYFILDGGSTQTGTSISINAEGIHSVEYWSVDKADNAEIHHTAQVKIDKTAPTINHTQSPDANGNGWNNSDVTVTFVCGDNLSGVASCTDPQTVTNEGQAQLVTGIAQDNAGNSNTDPATLSIDKTAPTIEASANTTPNGNGWYNTDVTVSFTCDDALSGIASCPPAQTLVEGASQSASGTAIDAADNSASTSITGINVDKTAPSLSGAATSSPNSYGWYDGDVTVHWTCSEALSGLDGACPADSLIDGEGTNLSASASVSDLAGNSTSKTVSGINIDRTKPDIQVSATVGGNPYLAGTWTNQDVTITFACSDDLSGAVSTGSSTVVSAQGAAQSVSGICTDKAGNSISASFDNIQIDKTAPTLDYSVAPAANAASWNNSDVTVTWSCSDGLSGVSGSCPAAYTFTGEGTNFWTSASITDQAGNSTAKTVSGINIDRTQPTITVSAKTADDNPYTPGTWTNQTVTVHFECNDGLSGYTSCPADVVYSSDGITSSTTRSMSDKAGNSASATFGEIKIDKTGPILNPVATPSSISLNGTVTITANASDPLSGLASSSCGTPDTSTFGTKMVTCTATDNAGNTNSAYATYSVVWNFNGFFQPVDNLPTVNTVKAGQGVPVKFSLGGNQGLAIFAPGSPSSQKISCDSHASLDVIEETVTAGSSSLSYDATTDMYIYTWKTDKAWAGTCRVLTVKFVDGSSHQANFYLTK